MSLSADMQLSSSNVGLHRHQHAAGVGCLVIPLVGSYHTGVEVKQPVVGSQEGVLSVAPFVGWELDFQQDSWPCLKNKVACSDGMQPK